MANGISLAGALLLTSIPQAAQPQPGPRVEGPFPARDGEICVVCNGNLSPADAAYFIDGQRVGVMKDMQEDLLREPLRYVSRLRPENATAHARQTPQPAGYILVGLFVLSGLVLGGACAHMAVTKGYPPWTWFLLGFCFSAPAAVALAFRPPAARPAPSSLTPVPCPACGRTNHPRASACLRCGAALTPAAAPEASPGCSE